ncbi:MAG: transcriptional regulator [Microbacteriaceae bacterium]|jgi:hypothetical protein|nr:transcriptional regulator [Microbacteriaceae bacterium]HEV7955619.1 MarR family transcriptional regulator [Marisediminicola sp.]
MAERRPIGFWLKLVDRRIEGSFAATLEEHGVTRRQWQLLNVLGNGPASREELDAAVAPFLGGATETGPAETTDAEIAELVESDWVAESVSSFVLTPRGRQSFERLAEVVGTIRASLADGVDEADYDTTVRTLERMARNLGWEG